jgi:23S rRNA pseudouridine1911/1915/1917 synthase
MTVKWTVTKGEPKRLKEFLKDKGISRRIIGRTKFHGGSFEVNEREVYVREPLAVGDKVQLNLPIEEANPNLYTSDGPLDILFEDEHFLILNKPNDLLSVPSSAHRGDTIASRVKGYFMRQNYRHQVVHVVTRLDRYTTGAMLIAKNALAHSMMGKQLEEQVLKKYYVAIVEGHLNPKEGLIDAPIARSPDSIIERVVHPSGKPSVTQYEMTEKLPDALAVVCLSLPTGRTHQIRVHLSHLGHPLVGDDLYGGSKKFLNRQALHCQKLVFDHPFTDECLAIEAPLPKDMQELVDRKME